MSDKQATIDQCIALAGLSQAVRIVQHVAWKGQTNATDFKAVLASLLRQEAPSAAAVYAGSFEVSTGLRLLSNQIDPTHKDKDPEFVGLVIAVMNLQQQLEKNKNLMDRLGKEINGLSLNFSSLTFYNDDTEFDRLLKSCSEAYQETLSKLATRIQVKGEPKFLKQTDVQYQVRAALLAAIRACFLWRQSGGTRWHFLFKKGELLKAVKYLVANPIKE